MKTTKLIFYILLGIALGLWFGSMATEPWPV